MPRRISGWKRTAGGNRGVSSAAARRRGDRDRRRDRNRGDRDFADPGETGRPGAAGSFGNATGNGSDRSGKPQRFRASGQRGNRGIWKRSCALCEGLQPGPPETSGLKHRAGRPICFSVDTAGISNESGEPGPGMMTGTYQAKDAENVLFDSNECRFARSAELYQHQQQFSEQHHRAVVVRLPHQLTPGTTRPVSRPPTSTRARWPR